MQNRSLILVACISLLVLNIIVAGTLFFITSMHAPTGRAGTDTAETRFCINNPPDLSIPCAVTLSQGQNFSCQLNISDIDGHEISLSQLWLTNQTLFEAGEDGEINFTPTNEQVGNHTVVFYANDQLRCDNSEVNAQYDFEVLNINDPPFLAISLPNREFTSGGTLSAFFLDDYFDDPDGDELSYTASLTSVLELAISDASEVVVTDPRSVCTEVEETIIFEATDPNNASAESNVVRIKAKCPQETPSTGGGATGAGGGGGGGASSICRSDWQCDAWKPCMPNNIQRRRCFDLNGCEDEKYLERMCEWQGTGPLCKENWLCDEWGPCQLNSTQYRECNDLSSCNTDFVKPPISQQCTYIASCNDGVQNGNETGIDCGGECAACALVQKPSPIEVSGKLSTWLMILILLAVLMISGVMRYYRAEILKIASTLGFILRRTAFKDVLLSAIQRQNLFERISAYEVAISSLGYAKVATPQVSGGLAELIRHYVCDALDIEFEFIEEDATRSMSDMGVRDETKAVFSMLLQRLEGLESGEVVSKEGFLETTELVRTAVCLTSSYRIEDIGHPMIELELTEDMAFEDEVSIRAIRIMRALQFDEVALAKEEYSKLLEMYDILDERERETIYGDVRGIYGLIRFQSEIEGKRLTKPL